MSQCEACKTRAWAGFDGMCPSCAAERTRAALAVERSHCKPFFNHSDEMTAAYHAVCGCERCAAFRADAPGATLAAIHADNPNPVRKIAITVFVESDSEPVEIAKSFRQILDSAGVSGYQMAVAPVESKL